jgi:hypothetical protein
LIAPWHDRKIGPGEDWRRTIGKNLKAADIYILLVSIDFINSSYCYDIEMDTALERVGAGTAEIVPVIARSCMWKITRFEPYQALPTDGKAISTWRLRPGSSRSSIAFSCLPAVSEKKTMKNETSHWKPSDL